MEPGAPTHINVDDPPIVITNIFPQRDIVLDLAPLAAIAPTTVMVPLDWPLTPSLISHPLRCSFLILLLHRQAFPRHHLLFAEVSEINERPLILKTIMYLNLLCHVETFKPTGDNIPFKAALAHPD